MCRDCCHRVESALGSRLFKSSVTLEYTDGWCDNHKCHVCQVPYIQFAVFPDAKARRAVAMVLIGMFSGACDMLLNRVRKWEDRVRGYSVVYCSCGNKVPFGRDRRGFATHVREWCMNIQKGCCYFCGVLLGNYDILDHFDGMADNNNLGNASLVCHRCHAWKTRCERTRCVSCRVRYFDRLGEREMHVSGLQAEKRCYDWEVSRRKMERKMEIQRKREEELYERMDRKEMNRIRNLQRRWEYVTGERR